ncbi:hypothetical protein DAPPUDRAFT_249246 [Daphnia pulex]|uniref:Uncharacterized protein n=1 Tax=Daphnia pulex TaxID=6669 RepID=E9GW85_DAPPU|nr:hypothetical protein DAPPUDRAFT_249246 [Daphnia pulex]|eukprot:EFX76314.1 hypothetical protein DAPPUDRAFT_249246 [Daphnia pulex]
MSHWQNAELYLDLSEWVDKVEGENQYFQSQQQCPTPSEAAQQTSGSIVFRT